MHWLKCLLLPKEDSENIVKKNNENSTIEPSSTVDTTPLRNGLILAKRLIEIKPYWTTGFY